MRIVVNFNYCSIDYGQEEEEHYNDVKKSVTCLLFIENGGKTGDVDNTECDILSLSQETHQHQSVVNDNDQQHDTCPPLIASCHANGFVRFYDLRVSS